MDKINQKTSKHEAVTCRNKSIKQQFDFYNQLIKSLCVIYLVSIISKKSDKVVHSFYWVGKIILLLAINQKYFCQSDVPGTHINVAGKT